MKSFWFPLLFLLAPACLTSAEPGDVFDRQNLTAWCIVPFDAKKRGPEERAAMLNRLGITRFVYDYRAEHVSQFDEEMEAIKRHGVRLTGWWFPHNMNDQARHILEVIKRHGMKECDLWVTGGGANPKTPEEEAARVDQEAARIKPIAVAAEEAGVRVGLYNHGGWFGEPENQLAIIKRLREQGIENVGIVYNLHHGHGHVERFAELMAKMTPHLICLNLNGMVPGGDTKGKKILPVGQGDLDVALLRAVRDSGYRGPIGILNHTNEDAEGRLQDNLEGLDWVRKQLDGESPGPRPTPRTWPEGKRVSSLPARKEKGGGPQFVPSQTEVLGKALQGGVVLPGNEAYRTFPVTVECLVKLDSAQGFNILVACEPKSSAHHWELYTYSGSGVLSLYLPGRGGEYKSKVNLCDGQWHRVSAILEEHRVRLKIDNTEVLDAALPPAKVPPVPAEGLAIGRLVEREMGGRGLIDEVRISRGSLFPSGSEVPLSRTDTTLGLWGFDDPEQLKDTPLPAKEVAAFSYDRAPLRPEIWPNHGHPVNRERIYDFYSKQALHFKNGPLKDVVLPPFPGLDGGNQGHWGNQSDATWRDGRWNAADHGTVLSGVLKAGPLVVPKAVCVRLGAEGELAACFDPAVLDFPVVWKGGFLSLSETRHGFMDGIRPAGKIISGIPAAPSPEGSFQYRGFYRSGSKVLFSYSRGDEEILDAAWVEGGQFVRLRHEAESHPWKELRKGGPSQWPQVLETRGELGTGSPYALDTLTIPYENPYGTLFFVSDHDFLPDGTLVLCTMTGEVWLVRGVDEGLKTLRWKRFATGLHQPLGLVVADGKICVLGRDQITRLHDLNGDDEADFYECLTNAQKTSASGHDYLCGLQRDEQGRFYFASGNQGVCRVLPGEPVEVLATGLRNPNGLALSATGRIATSSQEGDWTPASMIYEIKPGGFYGLGGPKPDRETEVPLLYLPRGVDHSAGGQCFVESDAWGVPRGTLLTFSSGTCTGLVVLRDGATGLPQGAAWELPADFLSGAQRGRFHKGDGQLYVSGMYGWGCYGVQDGSLQRLRYTGGKAPLPVGWEVRSNGVMVSFSYPLDPEVAEKAKEHFAQCWNYITSSAYGSQEWSVKHPTTAGHDRLEIASAQVLDGGRRLFLETPALTPCHQLHLHLTTAKGSTCDLYVTVHRLGEPFLEFPGALPLLEKRVKTPTAPWQTALAGAEPNPWVTGKTGRVVRLDAALGLQFAQKEIVASPGERLTLNFHNPDAVPHNFLLAKPEALARLGDLANKMITDPEGPVRHYVPRSEDVLVYTDMVAPGGKFTIHFDAPVVKGNYPYLCTFPGHWMVMNGVLRVE